MKTPETKLEERIHDIALAALAANIKIDGKINGPVCLWVRRNVRYRPESEFFIVTLVTGEMADIMAQQGFNNRADRVAKNVFEKRCVTTTRSARG